MSDKIHLNDLFWTLQGEGMGSGRRALFVRFPYCNYECPWCDTTFNTYSEWTAEQFKGFASQEKARFAVLTGGEPMAHKHLVKVVNILKSENFILACETNGSLPIPKEIDFVTISPKPYGKNHAPYFVHEDNFNQVSEWKYVVDDKFDFNILKRHQPVGGVTYSLSPEYSNMKSNVKKIIEYIKLNPMWRMSLQTHKWIEIP